ncbi:uncharacterized protein LOC101756097 [Setaria italica]|nr:uncharacterized protein LOC101756097 [Setaria italica]
MSRPLERGGGGDTTRSLLELDGELAVANMQGEASLDIWALRDYEAEIWTLRHRVEVPPPTCSRYYDVLVTPLPWIVDVISLGGSAILIGEPYSVNVTRLYHLKDKKLIREVCFQDKVPTFVMFKESYVSRAFFDSPRRPDVAYINFSDHDEDEDGAPY